MEEGPVTIAPPEVVHELEQGARRLAKIVGYSGVATVEYLYSMVQGNYYFLEVNPRLQVRATTEALLLAWQHRMIIHTHG